MVDVSAWTCFPELSKTLPAMWRRPGAALLGRKEGAPDLRAVCAEAGSPRGPPLGRGRFGGGRAPSIARSAGLAGGSFAGRRSRLPDATLGRG